MKNANTVRRGRRLYVCAGYLYTCVRVRVRVCVRTLNEHKRTLR